MEMEPIANRSTTSGARYSGVPQKDRAPSAASLTPSLDSPKSAGAFGHERHSTQQCNTMKHGDTRTKFHMASAVEKNILRLQVAIHDAVAVQMAQRQHQLSGVKLGHALTARGRQSS